MDIETLKRVVCEAITTHTDELSCAECFELLDQYAEVTLVRLDAASRLPHVHDHLERCADCREEWIGLLSALQAFSHDPPDPNSTERSYEQARPCAGQHRGNHHA